MIRNLLLVGGDRRALEMERLLKEDGWNVDTVGLHEGDEKTVRMEKVQAALFGYPFSVREGTIPTLTGLTLSPGEVLAALPAGIPILTGRGMEETDGFVQKSYEEDGALCACNAAISAEAAVFEAMKRTEHAEMDMNVLVTGYGLFGRALACRLLTLGASVWIAARREQQRRLAACDGMKSMNFQEMHRFLPKMDMVFNTVPALIMGEKELKALKADVQLLELASAPGGFDRKMADDMGIRYAVLPGLPARYAPASAGMALKNAAVRLLQEVEG